MRGCVNHYPRRIRLGRKTKQTKEKKSHMERRNEENAWQNPFFTLPFPLSYQQTVLSLGVMYLSGHAVCCFFFFFNVCELLCCFESVRTVCSVQECGSMLRQRQVCRECVWKESLSEISGNGTGTRLLKSSLTLGTNKMSTTVAARANVGALCGPAPRHSGCVSVKIIAGCLSLLWLVIRRLQQQRRLC